MKNLIITLSLFLLIFTSCDKSEDTTIKFQDKEKNTTLVAAKKLSAQHDSIVLEMLNTDKQRKSLGLKAPSSMDENLDFVEVFNIIQEVTGVRPIVLENSSLANQILKSNSNNDNLYINLDVENLELIEYATSIRVANYLDQVDLIKQDSTKTISEMIDLISEIQMKLSQDPKATQEEIELFYNTTEILKGSLRLWFNERSINQKLSNRYCAKSVVKWSFWKKLAFVASADALGGILGAFTGGIVTVSGVAVYVPPSPAGAVVGAASLSYIASKMVGW